MRDVPVLACPGCRGELRAVDGAAGLSEILDRGGRCQDCGRTAPVVDGVLDFLAPAAPVGATARPRLGQRLMESERLVSIYESRWWRDSRLFARLTGLSLTREMELVDELLGLGPDDVVLDLGCGPGLYSRRFAMGAPERCVLGLDLSWPMLRYATREAGRARLTNLAFLHGDAQALPLAPASLDAASCCGALHLFPDPSGVVEGLGRVLKPGGRVALAVFRVRPDDRLPALTARWDRLAGLHRFGEDELRGLLAAAGFEPRIAHAHGVWMLAGGRRKTAV